MMEMPRLVRQNEVGVYWDEYEGMVVADAMCLDCEGKYLAWVEGPKRWYDPPIGLTRERSTPTGSDLGFFDLSFRHSFNDEPDDLDLPKYMIKVTRERMGAYPWNTVEEYWASRRS